MNCIDARSKTLEYVLASISLSGRFCYSDRVSGSWNKSRCKALCSGFDCSATIEKDCNAETILCCELGVNDKKMIEVKF